MKQKPENNNVRSRIEEINQELSRPPSKEAVSESFKKAIGTVTNMNPVRIQERPKSVHSESLISKFFMSHT